MPPPNDRPLIAIVRNLEAFTERLLCRIGNENESQRQELIDAISRAEQTYAGTGIASYIVYPYTRERGTEVVRIKGEIEVAHSDTEKLFTYVREIITKGKWESTSFNYGLFNELFKIVDGYQPLPEMVEVKTFVFTEVKKIMLEKIEHYIRMSQKAKEDRKIREEEMRRTKSSNQRKLETITLASDLERAKERARAHPEHAHFCLSWRMVEVDDDWQSTNALADTSDGHSCSLNVPQKSSEKVWTVLWIDKSGKAHEIEPTIELLSSLEPVGDVEKLNVILERNVKLNCFSILEEYLKRIRLLINPQDREQVALTDEQLIANGLSSTFVLRGRANAYSLSWINVLGLTSVPVALELYPELHAWLNAQDSLEAEQLLQLKSYLTSVVPSKSVNNELKNELEARLSQIALTRKYRLHNVHLLINPVDDKTNAACSDQQLIDENHLNTFVLRTQGEQHDLRWLNCFGVSIPVAINDYPALAQWLTDPNALKECYIPQTKFHLLNVNISAGISVADDLKKQLEQIYGDQSASSSNDTSEQISEVIVSDAANVPQAPPLPASSQSSRLPGKVVSRLTTEQLAQITMFKGQRNTVPAVEHSVGAKRTK